MRESRRGLRIAADLPDEGFVRGGRANRSPEGGRVRSLVKGSIFEKPAKETENTAGKSAQDPLLKKRKDQLKWVGKSGGVKLTRGSRGTPRH